MKVATILTFSTVALVMLYKDVEIDPVGTVSPNIVECFRDIPEDIASLGKPLSLEVCALPSNFLSAIFLSVVEE
tara:strand:- start:11093 stop:11314 length:222 start_codon:yes stop_codon:yes gene_type:complete